ncbi:MAG: hypothetical protein COA61_009920 [Zetaproteobacteria bacterium]|nr:hypothetical protein [Zetaproteobacteria bacterium]
MSLTTACLLPNIRRMLRSNKKNKPWLLAFSKSFLVLFIAQLLVSAVCISTAQADTTIRVAPVTAHCNTILISDDLVNTDAHHVSCTHCDTPESAVSAHAPLMSDSAVSVLLAIIILPQVSELSFLQHIASSDGYTSPHSATLLYQTTRRILI